MNDNDENGVRPASAKFRMRFSLLALLVFITLVSLLLGWLVQPNRVVATALFQVESKTPTVFGATAEQQRDKSNFEIVKKTQLALLKSNFVLTAAVRNPGISSLPVLQGTSDPVEWLQNHLEVTFPENAEILEIKLRGTKSQAQDLVRLTDAVADAYLEQVISGMHERLQANRDLLLRNLDILNQEIKRKFDEFLDIARESGRLVDGSGQVLQQLDTKRLDRVEDELMRLESELASDPGGGAAKGKSIEQRISQLHERQAELEKKLTTRAEKSSDLETRQEELEQLQRIANEISISLIRMRIEFSSPHRINKVQSAVISPDR